MSRIFAILFLTISIAQARTWVNTEGKHFEGILVESSNGQATIRLKKQQQTGHCPTFQTEPIRPQLYSHLALILQTMAV